MVWCLSSTNAALLDEISCLQDEKIVKHLFVDSCIITYQAGLLILKLSLGHVRITHMFQTAYAPCIYAKKKRFG